MKKKISREINMNICEIKKHLFFIISLLFICLVLGGCHANGTPSTTEIATSSTSPTSSQTTSTTTTRAPYTTPNHSIIASTPYYDLYTKDETTYLHWTVDVPTDAPWSDIFYHLEFASLSDLKHTLLSGSFSKRDLQEINHFEDDKSTEDILICDLSKLYEPVYNGNVPEYSVAWYGKGYKCQFSTDTMSGTFRPLTKKEYDSIISKYQAKQVNFTIIEQKYDPVKNADEFLGKDEKVVQYKHQTDLTTLWVREVYHNNANTPYCISVYGESNGTYFCYIMDSIEVIPDMLHTLSVKPLQ